MLGEKVREESPQARLHHPIQGGGRPSILHVT